MREHWTEKTVNVTKKSALFWAAVKLTATHTVFTVWLMTHCKHLHFFCTWENFKLAYLFIFFIGSVYHEQIWTNKNKGHLDRQVSAFEKSKIKQVLSFSGTVKEHFVSGSSRPQICWGSCAWLYLCMAFYKESTSSAWTLSQAKENQSERPQNPLQEQSQSRRTWFQMEGMILYRCL